MAHLDRQPAFEPARRLRRAPRIAEADAGRQSPGSSAAEPARRRKARAFAAFGQSVRGVADLADRSTEPWLGWPGRAIRWIGPSALRPAAAATWAALEVEGLLGEGASGQVFSALWRDGDGDGDGAAKSVALKLFKGAMDQRRPARTRNGSLPRRRRSPPSHRRPGPSRRSSRWSFGPFDAASPHPLAGAGGAAQSAELQPRRLMTRRCGYRSTWRSASPGVSAGRLNTCMGGGCCTAIFMGTTSCGTGTSATPCSAISARRRFLPDRGAEAFQRLEVRAFGLLLGELLDLCAEDDAGLCAWRSLQLACTQSPARGSAIAGAGPGNA